MLSFHARGVSLALVLALAAGTARGYDGFAPPSLLPLPPVEYPTTQVAHRSNLWQESGPAAPAEDLPSPSDATLPSPAIGTGVAPGYAAPPVGQGGYHSATPDLAYGDTCGEGCGPYGCGVCPNSWYASGLGLFMTKDHRHGFNTSIDDWDSTVVLSNCGCITGDLVGGFEVTLGRTFCCCQNAIEVTYWGLYPGENWADAYAGDMQGNLDTTWNLSDLDYDDGNGNVGPVGDWFNDTQHHSIATEYSIHSVEVNLLGQTCGGGVFGGGCCYNPCGPCLNFGWSLGIRYFQFNERFMFGSDDVDYVWDGSPNELLYENEVTNDLLGFQLGGELNFRFAKCWSAFVNGKAGVYGNHARNEQSVYGSNGYATMNNGPYAGQDYWIESSTYDLAMLAQLDAGVRWQINCNWALTAGYRVVGVSGVALYADQIPTDFSNYDVISDINTNGSLLLHGGFAGLEFCF
jgi:hypothetical protein